MFCIYMGLYYVRFVRIQPSSEHVYSAITPDAACWQAMSSILLSRPV